MEVSEAWASEQLQTAYKLQPRKTMGTKILKYLIILPV